MKSKLVLVFICLLALDLSVFAQTKEARKVDEFGNHSCEDYLARMDGFQIELQNEPNSKGYIMIYEGKSLIFEYDKTGKYVLKKSVLPQFGQAKSSIRTMIRRLAFRRFSREKIVFVEAGFRKNYAVEFWVVPLGAEPPKPTPTLKKMKYRKGKPKDFCGNDEV